MAFKQSAVITRVDIASGRVSLKQAAVFFDQVHGVEVPLGDVHELSLIVGRDFDLLCPLLPLWRTASGNLHALCLDHIRTRRRAAPSGEGRPAE